MTAPVPTVHRTRYRRSLRLVNRVTDWMLGHRFDVDGLLESAERTTGLSDWGDLDIQTPLRLLQQDFARHPPSGLGAIVLRSTFGKSARNRLEVRDAVRRGRASDPLPAPFIVTGLHRTGTTLLHHLLASLPNVTYIPMYRMMSPVGTRWSRWEAEAAQAGSRFIGPEFFRAHPTSAIAPEECWMLFMSTFRVADYQLHWKIPSFGEWVDHHDMRPAYGEYREQLQILSRDFPGRFALKGPGHLANLDALVATIPDARIIWTHRNPVSAVASFGTLSAVHRRTVYGRYDAKEIGPHTLERFALAARQGAEARPRMRPENFLDVPYRELAGDPVATVRRICEHFGEPFDERSEAALRARLTQLDHEKDGGHVYSLDQWGLDKAAIERAFEPYTAQFKDFL